MTCPTCYWQHTDVNAALICYRKSNPKPTEDRPRGDGVKPETGSQGVDSASTKRTSSLSTNPGTSETVFPHGRAGKSGRPRVSDVERRQKARERSREFRNRQRKRESAALATPHSTGAADSARTQA